MHAFVRKKKNKLINRLIITLYYKYNDFDNN